MLSGREGRLGRGGGGDGGGHTLAQGGRVSERGGVSERAGRAEANASKTRGGIRGFNEGAMRSEDGMGRGRERREKVAGEEEEVSTVGGREGGWRERRDPRALLGDGVA